MRSKLFAAGVHRDEQSRAPLSIELHVEEPLEFGEWSAPSNRAASSSRIVFYLRSPTTATSKTSYPSPPEKNKAASPSSFDAGSHADTQRIVLASGAVHSPAASTTIKHWGYRSNSVSRHSSTNRTMPRYGDDMF
jgi:hypothetical protein